MNVTVATRHIFEAAGLGLAPFRFVGIETDMDRAAVQRDRESAGMCFTDNHCTSCDYCSQAIHNAYVIQSADGKRFKVGCDCIRKTGDAGLKKVVADEESRKRREASNRKRVQRQHEFDQLVSEFRSGQYRDALAVMPHPYGKPGKTALDYVEFCVDNPRYLGDTVRVLLKRANTTTAPPFTVAVTVGNTTEEYTVNGYPAAVDRARFERERCPEAVVTITPGW